MLHSEWIYENIMDSMSEGVITINYEGVITYINTAGIYILGLGDRNIVNMKFAECFLDSRDNVDFVQVFMDAVSDRTVSHEKIIPYNRNGEVRHLRLLTSLLANQEPEKTDVIGVFGDLSDLIELQDALKAMERIEELNKQLNRRNELLQKTFGRYLSDEIVNELTESPQGLTLGGRKRIVTVLMSDLRGFTALCEHIEPEPMILMLNHYLEEMIDAIEKYNGTLIEIEGDGILAVFGALGEDPAHAEHAVAAALSMQSRLTQVNAWNEERGYPNLQMGIGINSGEAIVGNIGSEKRTRFNVIGSQVNLCGRIESYTVDGQVFISPNTRELVSAELTISGRMVVRPKGVEEELELYQIAAIGEPYNLKGRDETREPEPLSEPIPVSFYRLENKHETTIPYFGGIMAVSTDTAVLNTQTPLSVYDNIRINAGGKLLCKVVEEKKDGYLLRYTSIPVGYAEWLIENTEKNNKKKG